MYGMILNGDNIIGFIKDPQVHQREDIEPIAGNYGMAVSVDTHIAINGYLSKFDMSYSDSVNKILIYAKNDALLFTITNVILSEISYNDYRLPEAEFIGYDLKVEEV